MIDNIVIQYKTMELLPRRIFDVRCFGANGEDQVDDFDAIRDARDAVNAAGGGVLFFPPGTFIVRDTIELGPDTTVLGSGAASVLLAKPTVPAFDYAIVNNVVNGNARWGIVASGGVGTSPEEGHPMSKRYVVANNICSANTAGGITLDPSTRDGEEQPTGVIHDSFATVAGNVCADNTGAGIHTIHAGYVAVHGNVCDGTLSSGKDSASAGIAIVSSRHTVVGDNVLIANKYGVAFWGDPGTVPPNTPEMGHHLLGGNVYDGNNEEIHIGGHHPTIRQLHERPPGDEWGGINLPVNQTPGNPANGVDGALYLNTQDRRLQMYAGGAWRTLETTNDPSW